MPREYMFVFDQRTTFQHHLELLLSYLGRAFPDVPFSMLDDCTLVVGDASLYRHLPLRWGHSGAREWGPVVQYVLGFVSGDENDTFAMGERVVDHGWYEAVAIS